MRDESSKSEEEKIRLTYKSIANPHQGNYQRKDQYKNADMSVLYLKSVSETINLCRKINEVTNQLGCWTICPLDLFWQKFKPSPAGD